MKRKQRNKLEFILDGRDDAGNVQSIVCVWWRPRICLDATHGEMTIRQARDLATWINERCDEAEGRSG